MKLFRTLYRSRATSPQKYSDLRAILDIADDRNRRDEITGMLGFGRGIFFQYLEGPQENVNRTLSRILKDTRHTDIVLLDSCEIPSRLFPEWTMKLVAPDDMPTAALKQIFEEHKDDSLWSQLDASTLQAFFRGMAISGAKGPPQRDDLPQEKWTRSLWRV